MCSRSDGARKKTCVGVPSNPVGLPDDGQTDFRSVDIEVMRMENSKEKTTEWLPVVDFDGDKYVIDFEARAFRSFNDPNGSVSFYSDAGRQMAKAMMGTEWRTFTARELWEKKDEQVV